MPFTLFHLGPALAIGLPLRKHLHSPTFIVGNLVLDIEPFMVIVLGLNYPLHAYLHTFLSALIVGLLLGFVMYKLEKPMQPLYKVTLLETDCRLRLKSFLLAGVFGTTLHVLFDAVLYSEMAPFFPWTINPLIGIGLSTVQVYSFCIGLGIIGIVYYVVTVVYSLFKKNHKKRNSQLRFKF